MILVCSQNWASRPLARPRGPGGIDPIFGGWAGRSAAGKFSCFLISFFYGSWHEGVCGYEFFFLQRGDLGATDLRGIDPTLWPGFPALENGDVNSNGNVDLSDSLYLLSWLFNGGPEPAPLACATTSSTMESGDSNGDGAVDFSDPIHILSFLFGGAAPLNACGVGDGQGAGAHQNHSPGILQPQAHAFGKILGEWTAAWWQ